MGYVVIEIQTMADGQVGTLITHYDNVLEAESAYHSKLASAAISDLPVHAVTMLTDDGSYVQHQSYKHGVE